MLTVIQKMKLQDILSEYAKSAENGDNIKIKNGEVIIYNSLGTEIDRQQL